jgi:hypothetical protein
MVNDSQPLKELSGQMSHLLAEMVGTRTEMQSIRAAIEHLTQKVQTLIDDRPRPKHNNSSFSCGGPSYLEESSSGDGCKPKIVQLKFPRFDGEDPEKRCCSASQYLDFYGTPDAQRLSISSYHMDGKARVWFREWNATQSVSRWDEFVEAIKAWFSALENVENLEQVKDEDEEKRDDEANHTIIPESETDPVDEFVEFLQEQFSVPAEVENQEEFEKGEERWRSYRFGWRYLSPAHWNSSTEKFRISRGEAIFRSGSA